MQIKDSVALVTGANRGLGLAFARALLARGARKVYAAARDARSITLPGVVPLQLDVTSDADIAAAVAAAPDVTLLVNNAGIARGSSILASDALAAARAELETNLFGPFALSRAFAPVLAAHGGGGIINVLSVLSWVTMPAIATYSLSKAAAWALTNGLRAELAAQHTQVLALHVGYMDTDMAARVTGPKTAPRRSRHSRSRASSEARPRCSPTRSRSRSRAASPPRKRRTSERADARDLAVAHDRERRRVPRLARRGLVTALRGLPIATRPRRELCQDAGRCAPCS